MKIVIVDYGMGNSRSVIKAFNRIGFDVSLSSNHKNIEEADRLVLPGVGHFSEGVNNLNEKNLREILQRKVLDQKTPILGICLGMQLMAKNSEEGEGLGLGWVNGTVKRFNFASILNKQRVPHIGWNSLDLKKSDPLFKNVSLNGADFYFVHSYHFTCDNEEDILATTTYGYPFVSAIQKGNIYGVQFHPEKSLGNGLTLLKNFALGI